MKHRLLVALSLGLAAGGPACAQATAPAATPPELVRAVREAARPVAGQATDYDNLMALVGDARVVLLGEASHGTHEFYRERARITRRLIEEKGFDAVAIEGDWPAAERVDRFVRGEPGDATAVGALAGFDRFPRWMWRNPVVLEFVNWLRTHNARRPAGERVGFYGLDLYSLKQSARAAEERLRQVDPALAGKARERYACFDAISDASPQDYGLASLQRSCQEPAIAQLREAERALGTRRDPASLSAIRNAAVVVNAEHYYRASVQGTESTWNIRDRHMAGTLDAILGHVGSAASPGKVVVWAHNSHVGDARASEMGEGGEVNLGQLARETYGEDAVLVGFTTYTGTVRAADVWGEPARVKTVRPSLEGSLGRLHHEVGLPAFSYVLRGAPVAERLREPRLERAIGVIYRPETERQSHYFLARPADRWDALVHLETTRALDALPPATGLGLPAPLLARVPALADPVLPL